MTELRSCPFCGGNPRILHDVDGTPSGVLCKCGAIVKFIGVSMHNKDNFGDMQERIMERYNRRSGE